MKNKYLNLFILITVILFGIFLRIHAYLINTSFFVDEILLGFNVINKSYADLFLPLEYAQAAPGLFLILTKLVISKLGVGELAFRLIPFVSSILSIFAFYFLSKKILQRFWVQILALFLFCINFQLLFYTQAFKQYSSDVLIAILILFVAIFVDIKKLKLRNAFLLGILSSIAFCFSFTTLFVVAGVSAVYLICSKEFRKIFIFIFPNLITLATYFVLTLHSNKSSEFLSDYWAKGFNVFNHEIYKINFDFLFSFYNYPLFFLFLLCLGIFWAYKSDKLKTLLLVSPVITTLLAAMFKIYPFERRLILFLLPIFLILIVIPLDKVNLNNMNFHKKVLNIFVIIISSVFFLNYFITYSTSFISQKVSYIRQDVKPLLKRLIKEKKEQDILYVYYGAGKTYLYYNLITNLPKDNLYIGAMPPNEKEQSDYIEQDLALLPKHRTIWFFFVKGNNLYDEDVKHYKNWLYKNGKIEENIVLKSARLMKVHL